MGPKGYLVSRGVERERIYAVDQADILAWTVLPHLEKITIGDVSPVSVEKDAQGRVVKVIHEWTGRVEEYVKAKYPSNSIWGEYF